MLPGKDTERLLLEKLIPGICNGICGDKDLPYYVNYVNYKSATYENIAVWIVYGYIEPKDNSKTNGYYGSMELPVPIVMIPRLNDDGLYNLYGDLYYIVTRQRVVANVPICTIDGEEHVAKRVTCSIRSTNMSTGESRVVNLKRIVKSGKQPILYISHTRGKDKNENIIPAVEFVLKSIMAINSNKSRQEAVSTIMDAISIMGFSSTISSIVSLELNVDSSFTVDIDKYILPHTVKTNCRHIEYPLGNLDITAEILSILYMICKTVAVEVGELPPDDQDNYANKIVELPSTLLALTIRKVLRKDFRNTNLSSWKDLHVKVYREVYKSLKENKWTVVDRYDTELQLSRNAYGIPVHGLKHALREVIIYRTTVSSTGEKSNVYELRQANSTQRGILCMLTTPDDDNAGLRQYLAIDCSISTEYNHLDEEEREDEDEDDDNMMTKMRDELSLHISNGNSKQYIWMHNYVYRGIYTLDALETTLNNMKDEYRELSWHIVGGIVESRYHYGRFIVKVDNRYYDAAELILRCPEEQKKARPYTELIYSTPLMQHRPPARSLLGARMISKSIGIPVVGHRLSSSYKLLDSSDDDYPLKDIPKVTTVHQAMKERVYGRQSPLVRTEVDNRLLCGTHVILAEMPYRGYGVEDGIVISRSAAERGMFAIKEKVFIVWDPSMNRINKILRVNILARRGDVILEDQAIVAIHYIDEYSKETITYIRQKGSYSMILDEIHIVTFTSKISSHIDLANIARIEVAMYRYKLVNTGDKVALPDGQKQIIVKIATDDELPTLSPVEDDEVLDSILRARNYKPDMIMDPLSIISRSTMSQIISSTLALRCIMEGHDYVLCESFGDSYYIKGDEKIRVDITKLPRVYCKATMKYGSDTVEIEQPVAIGCAYTILPPHLADTKPKGLGVSNIDNVTGMPHKSAKDTAVKVGWQEMYAILHSNSQQLIDYIYKSNTRLDQYPYCDNCNRTVEIKDGMCAMCTSNITSTIQLPKSYRSVMLALCGMGCDMYYSK